MNDAKRYSDAKRYQDILWCQASHQSSTSIKMNHVTMMCVITWKGVVTNREQIADKTQSSNIRHSDKSRLVSFLIVVL